MLRKFTSILLVGVLTLPLMGTYLWLQGQRVAVRQVVKEQLLGGMDADELVPLTFTVAECQGVLRWEHAREFVYGHQRYDVVRADTVGDRVTFYCWQDDAESQLDRQLEALTRTALGQGRRGQERRTWVYGTTLLKYVPSACAKATAPVRQRPTYAPYRVPVYAGAVGPPHQPPPRRGPSA